MYVVVCVGATCTLFPRTAPTLGDITKYEAPEAVQLSVTGEPAELVEGEAVKLEIEGDAPVGTFDEV